jgi:uncharacterized Tic20 family protein
MTEDTATRQDAPSRTQQSNGLAIAGFVCGLAGLLLFAVILGPLAVIFGGVGLARANKGARHRGLAIAAVILGIADVILWGVLLAVSAKHGGAFSFHVGG